MKKTVQTNYVKYGELRQIKGVTTIIRADIAGKQDKLTTIQMAAVDSGITAAKVLSYDNAASLAHSHANKTSVLDKLRWDAQNNAVCIGDAEHPINFCAFGAVTAGGVGSDGSGGGGISTIYLGTTRYDAAQGSSAIYLPAYPTQVAGVTSLGGATGAITVRGGQTANGSVNLTMIGTQLQASIVGLGSIAYKSSLSASDIPSLDWSKITTGKPTTIAGYGITDGVTTATLAEWAGSVNITKVGTIATGVWHGTAIGDTYIASATNWNDAYDKRHTHSNKTVLDSITAQDLTDLRNLASWLGFDSTNNAVYVKKSATNVARNFYVFGAITAGDVGSGGGGSTGALYTCVDVTAYNNSKVGRDSTHPAQSGDLLAFDGSKWHAVVAPATGVTAFGGASGAITLGSNLAMTGNQLGLTGVITTSNIAQQAVAALTTSSLSKETDIVESGLRTYSGSGGTWTGSISSMAYAAIIALGGSSGRGLQIWARRGTGNVASLHYRVPKDDMTEWAAERIVVDSENYTSYCATAAQGAKADTAYGWGNHASAGYAAASSLSNYLPLSGGTITGTIQIGNAATIPFVRNFTALVSSGWERKIASIRVDGVDKFIIGAYGLYTLGASDNGVSYAYLGLNAYNGNNLRIYSDHLAFGANTIYHAGNLTAATLGAETAAHASATYQPLATAINTGNIANQVVERARTVTGSYTGSGGQQNPDYFGKNKVGFIMMRTTVNGNSHYKDWLIMDCYQSNDVGGSVAFGINRQALGAYIMRSASTRDAWSQSAELFGTHNANTSDVAWACSTLTASGEVRSGNGSYGVLLEASNTIEGMSGSAYGNLYIQSQSAKNLYLCTGGGNVGVGTNSPSVKLHTVATSSGWTGLFANGNNAVYLANGSGYGAWIGVSSTSSNNYILRALYGCTGVGSGGTTAMIILANGNVGINTGTPTQKLHVVGNIVATGAITAGGASDARLKDNIRNLANAVTVLKSLRPVSFDWNATATSNYSALKGHDVGLVAQEVEPYIPSAIGTIFEDYKRLDYAKVTPYLIAGWQDHESRVSALERENAELKRRLNIN